MALGTRKSFPSKHPGQIYFLLNSLLIHHVFFFDTRNARLNEAMALVGL